MQVVQVGDTPAVAARASGKENRALVVNEPVLTYAPGDRTRIFVAEQEPVVIEDTLDPANRLARGPAGLVAGAALQEHDVRPVLATDRRDLPREHRDRPAVGCGMVQRNRVLPFREDDAGGAMGDGHRSTP